MTRAPASRELQGMTSDACGGLAARAHPVRAARHARRRADDDARDPRAQGVGARAGTSRCSRPRAGAAVAALVPEIDDVIVYDPPWMKATPPRSDSRAGRATDRAAARRPLRRGGRSSPSTARTRCPPRCCCYLADIPLRLAHCRENPYQLLTDWVPEPEPARTLRHEVRRQLDLVAAVGCRTERRPPVAPRRRVLRGSGASARPARGGRRSRVAVRADPPRRHRPVAALSGRQASPRPPGSLVARTGLPGRLHRHRPAKRAWSRRFGPRCGAPVLLARRPARRSPSSPR